MPHIYLSPSTQEFNPYITGNSEEYYMNLIADAMEPYLVSNGITFTRNTPEMTAASSIRASNAGNYDLHLALHSNAAPPDIAGTITGTDVYYSPRSQRGRRMADLLVEQLKLIYPNPQKVRAVSTSSIGEVSRTRAPAVLIEFAYHDNVSDATWIINNISPIARSVVIALTQYFGIPFVEAQPPQQGVVDIDSGWLNIRQRPSLDAPVLAEAEANAPITVLGRTDGWYVVNYNGTVGYAFADYVDIY